MTFRFPSVHCKDLFPSISREELLSDISICNWRLPSPYLEFLSEHNGISYKGRPRQLLAYQYAMDRVMDGKFGFKLQFKQWPRKQVHTDHCGFIDELFGLADKSPYDIRHQQGCYGFSDSVPTNFIAIGGACDTSLVAICLNGEWEGKIFRWTPAVDLDAPEERNTVNRLHFIAHDFTDFWRGLAEIPKEAVVSA